MQRSQEKKPLRWPNASKCTTPKHAGWLNMVEIELSVLARQCLRRRIGDIQTLEHEVLALVKKRNDQKATVQWRFIKNDARIKLEKLYPN